jgi:hypothetical protein
MSDPATHSDGNRPETNTWTPADDFEREHEAAIRERLKGGYLLPSQAVLAVRNQLAQDSAQRPAGQTIEGNLGAPTFKPADDFEKTHEAAIRERMRGGITRAQAVQCVRDQLEQDRRAAEGK